jgi:hypothetical protein
LRRRRRSWSCVQITNTQARSLRGGRVATLKPLPFLEGKQSGPCWGSWRAVISIRSQMKPLLLHLVFSKRSNLDGKEALLAIAGAHLRP